MKFKFNLTLLYFIINFSITLFYILSCPFTKVEESFNLQASHDILKFGLDIEKYDHLEFPGVVPRTFLGPIILTSCVYPIKFLLQKFNIEHDMLIYQYLVRVVLGLLNSIASTMLFNSILNRFGTKVGYWFMLFSCTQFHIWFWCSRTIPNSFSLILTTMAFSYYVSSYLKSDPKKENPRGNPRQLNHLNKFFILMTISGIVFRSETLFLLGFYCLFELLFNFQFQTIQFILNLIKLEIGTLVICLMIVIPIDSFFWKQNFMWAEGQVFYFNAILGKSEAWGTMPFISYFSRFLPKILHWSYLFTLIGLAISPRNQLNLIPSIIYILFMSCLGHKEWRFIEYTFPLFTLSASITCDKIFRLIPIKLIKFSLIVLILFTSSLYNFNLNYISSLNYSGGYGLQKIHYLFKNENNLIIHLDTYTAMTGASRFGELRNDWKYSKLENIENEQDYLNYDILLTNEADKHNHQHFELIDCIQGYHKIQIQSIRNYQAKLTNQSWNDKYELMNNLLPYKIIKTNQVCILKKIVK